MATVTISNAGGNWNDAGTWVGGVPPTAADNVVATATSGAVTIAAAGVCLSIDLSLYASTLTQNTLLTVSGNLDFSGTWIYAGTTKTFTFSASSTGKTLKWGGRSPGDVTFGYSWLAGGWTLLDAMTATGTLTLTRGALDNGGNTVTALGFSSANSNARSTAGDGQWVIGRSGPYPWYVIPTNMAWGSTGAIVLTYTGAVGYEFRGGDITTYGPLVITAGGTAIITFIGSNTFASMTIGAPKFVKFTSGSVQTITGNFVALGSVGNIITISAVTPGAKATLSKASGIVSCDYLSLQDSEALGGASWYAGANSTNVSGNSGWVFTAPPAAGGLPIIGSRLLGRTGPSLAGMR